MTICYDVYKKYKKIVCTAYYKRMKNMFNNDSKQKRIDIFEDTLYLQSSAALKI